tara:strand:+ start:1863 stop:3452 length:1590 start_codon:yes stop_codon:yes gene_type:complete
MLATLLRLGALIALPFATAGVAAAQYDDVQDEAALILFGGENYTGSAVNVFDPIYSLPDIQFNDRARSVAVLSGAWELCEHSDFTGRCVFLREDVPDLRYYGLEGQVSSVRPIYEYTDAENGLMFVRDENGYIRYADDAQYGYDTYSHGYGATTRVEVYHYGYSPAYRSYGYYDPLAGYGPYGFGYSRGGYNTYRAYHRERPPLRGHYGARDADATLYVDSNGRGASLGINRGVRDLSRYRFNDNVSSLNIKSGKWEVCEHANFKGRCEIIDASTGKLNGLRLNDNISSIRPVGGDRDNRGDGRDRGHRGDNAGRGGNDYAGRDRGGRGDEPRADRGQQGDRGQRGPGRPGGGRGADALAGGPGTIPSLPDTTLPNRQPQRGFVPQDPISKTVQPSRQERPRGDAVRRDVPRIRDAGDRRGGDQQRARPDRQGERRPQPQRQQTERVLPQTPAMQSRQPVRAPVQAAPQVRAPAPQVRAPQVRAVPPPVRVAPQPRPQVQAAPERQVRADPRSPAGIRARDRSLRGDEK